MGWNYSGDPSRNSRDEVRFLVGDTCREDPQVQDGEIAYAIGAQPNLKLAAAMVLRALAAKYSKIASSKVGDVSESTSDIAKAYAERANELDPNGITSGVSLLVLPRFGGLSISEKETLAADTDAVQPSFVKGMNDIPGGPGNITNDDERLS